MIFVHCVFYGLQQLSVPVGIEQEREILRRGDRRSRRIMKRRATERPSVPVVVVGLLLTSAFAFVTTGTSAPRRFPAHRAMQTASDLSGAEAATAAPKLLVGESDFETFVGR